MINSAFTNFRSISLSAGILLLITITACTPAEDPETDFAYAPEEAAEEYSISPVQLEFWERLQAHCGNAYSGRVGDATPYYASVAEAEQLRIHIRECSDSLTHISLHVDDDNSRNLMLTKTVATLRLKHDHRYPDGREEEISQYGGDAPDPGLETRQIFEADEHTEDILPDRFDNFWFLDIMDEETLAYGVHWPKHGHSIRLEFDLSETIAAPPAPWGYEE